MAMNTVHLTFELVFIVDWRITVFIVVLLHTSTGLVTVL
jgi:hypothetical protein